MPWTRQGGWESPWLPLEDTSRNVEDQRSDAASTLHFSRDLIALRRRTPELRTGAYEELPAPAGTWAWRRGDDVVVAANLGSDPAEIEGIDGTVALATVRVEDPEGRPPPRWPEPVAGDECLGLLSDHVAPEPDPAPPGQLEPEAGRLVPPGDVPALAEAVVSLLENEPARQELGRAARVLAQNRYSWEGIAQRLSEIYEGLVDSRKAVAA